MTTKYTKTLKATNLILQGALSINENHIYSESLEYKFIGEEFQGLKCFGEVTFTYQGETCKIPTSYNIGDNQSRQALKAVKNRIEIMQILETEKKTDIEKRMIEVYKYQKSIGNCNGLDLF